MTGNDETGRSMVVHDDVASMVLENAHWPGRGQTRLWLTNSKPSTVGFQDEALNAKTLEPPPGGTHFLIAQVMPESDLERLPPQERERVYKALFSAIGSPGIDSGNATRPAMHKTPSIDYVTVLTGEVTLLLDDGEITLRPFDTIIQRGTNHAWVNRGKEPALLAVVLVDANRSGNASH